MLILTFASMDIEGFVKRRLKKGTKREIIIKELAEAIAEFKNWDLDKRTAFAREVVAEAEISENYKEKGDFVENLLSFPEARVGMGEFGVGSRGKGDFFVHRKIADIIGKTSALIDSSQQDDAGVVKAGESYITVAVDGMHSRLSDFPFLAGFHASRAALRDIYVMGSKPVALTSDLHLADDGDIGKLFDFTAGVSLVGELTSTPLVAGSTLRVGGDMVFGTRLVASVGAVGFSEEKPKARKNAEDGDVILITEGSGGGTISTIAIYHGFHEVVKETLNVEFMLACGAIMKSEYFSEIHAMTDITNGGIRGDAHEIAKTSGKRLIFYNSALEKTVNPRVLKMLEELNIDPLGISTDSLMIILPEEYKNEILKTLEGVAKVYEVGRVEKGRGVYIESQEGLEKLEPKFREASYTKVKKFIGESYPEEFNEMKERIEKAAKLALEKKSIIKEFILRRC